MNKKRNVDSGRKSARPDYIQKTISQKSSGKRSGKVFFPKTLIKTGGIIIFRSEEHTSELQSQR